MTHYCETTQKQEQYTNHIVIEQYLIFYCDKCGSIKILPSIESFTLATF